MQWGQPSLTHPLPQPLCNLGRINLTGLKSLLCSIRWFLNHRSWKPSEISLAVWLPRLLTQVSGFTPALGVL